MFPHPKEVFLCHSSLDLGFAAQIAEILKHHDVPAWYSHAEILGGQQWHDEIGEALRRCDWFAILLSPDSVNSFWVKHELLFAFRQKRLEGRIIPVVFRPCDYEKLSWTFPSYQLVDFTEDFEKGCRALLRIWGIGYQAIQP